MNISKFPAICLSATVFAFAQFPWEVEHAAEPSEPPPSVFIEKAPSSSSSVPVVIYSPTPASSSSSVAETPVAPEGKTIFDSVRGHAYNPYSIAGAASTVTDLVRTPSDIYQQKFIYISPSDFLGYTAFSLGQGGSGFIGLDESSTEYGELAALKLGYANSGFGIVFDISLGKGMRSYAGYDRRWTFPGDNLGFYFSMPIGSATLYANAGWLTYESNYVSNDNISNSEDNSKISSNIGVTGTANIFNYDAFLDIARISKTQTDNSGKEYIFDGSKLDVSLVFNFSITALRSEMARAIIGFNNCVGVEYLNATSNSQLADNIIFSAISPNILGEVALFDNLLAFAGATHNLVFVFGDGNRDDVSTVTLVQTGYEVNIYNPETYGTTHAYAGLRYQRKNWALETIVSTHPFEIMNGENIFAKFGGFVYF